MTERTEDQTHRPKVSQVDRAYPNDVPRTDKWSLILPVAFLLALLGVSAMSDSTAVPGAFRAAFIEWTAPSDTSPPAN